VVDTDLVERGLHMLLYCTSARWLAVDVAVVLVLVGRGAGDVAGPRSAGDGAERRGGDGAGWCWAGLDNSSGLPVCCCVSGL
jgi:hypothetical protein